MNICVLEHPRIRSEKRFNDIANTPLWSCLMGGYVAASLKQAGHDICYLDAANKGWDFGKTLEKVLDLSPDLICVNAVYIWEHTTKLIDFLWEIKANGFAGHVSLFGFFPTLAYNEILKNAYLVDSIALGECENTFVQLATRLARGENWKDTTGLAFLSSTGVKLSGIRSPEKNLEKLPFPLRELEPTSTASILASRGCYNHCSFCPIPSFYNNGPLWRGRTPENVYKEMAELTDKGYGDFYFADPNFIGPGKNGKKRISMLMDLILPLKITFGMETRPNDLDAYILERLVLAGFKSLLLGIESASLHVLDGLNKGSIHNNDGKRAIDLCRDAGIEPEIGFLMFVPDSSVDDLKINFEFLKENNLLDRLDRTANIIGHRQIVFMGTSGYRQFEEEGRLKKAGVLGFEGDVSYRDEKVRWISGIMVHACLFVLAHMEKADSPVHWRKSHDCPESLRVNRYLVSLFDDLLFQVQKGGVLPLQNEMKKDIEMRLQKEIGE